MWDSVLLTQASGLHALGILVVLRSSLSTDNVLILLSA